MKNSKLEVVACAVMAISIVVAIDALSSTDLIGEFVTYLLAQ